MPRHLPIRFEARAGMTVVELLMAFAVVAAVSAALFGIVMTTTRGRVEDQDAVERQQAMALTLTTFSEDVRAGNGLLNATVTGFTLRQPLAAGGYRYVSYQLAGDRLQRGVSTQKGLAPTTWTDVFDASLYKVAAGQFSYFLLGNAGGTNPQLMRRIEITGFELRSRRTNDVVRTAPISAVMREASNARDLVIACPPDINGNWVGSQQWMSGTVHIGMCLENRSDAPVTIDAFTGVWDDGGANNPLEYVRIGSVAWGNGQTHTTSGGPVQALGNPVTIGAGTRRDLSLDFHPLAGKIHTIALELFASSDTARTNPYLAVVSIP